MPLQILPQAKTLNLEHWEEVLRLPVVKSTEIPQQKVLNYFQDHDIILSKDEEKKVIEYFGTSQNALKLAVTYLKTQEQYISAFEKIPVLLGAEVEDYNIHRLMMAFEKLWPTSAEIACLYALALFPYPVSQTLFQERLLAVQKNRSIQSRSFRDMTDALNNYSSEQLVALLQRLEADGFLLLEDETIKTLRPIQRYFETRFKTLFFAEWQQHQQQLSKYYSQQISAPEYPDKPEEQFWHACKGLLHSPFGQQKKQGISRLYEPHIKPLLHENSSQSQHESKLNLYLLKPFFQQRWHKPDFSLERSEKNKLITWAGHSLHQLGNTRNAAELLEKTLPELTQRKSWALAGKTADILSGHAVEQEDTLTAIELSRQSVAYADLSNDKISLLSRLVKLLELYEKNGYLREADVLLQKAENLLAYFAGQESTKMTNRLSHIIKRLKINEQQLVG